MLCISKLSFSLVVLVSLLGLPEGKSQVQDSTARPSPTPQSLSTSPDGRFLLRREQAESDDLGRVRKSIYRARGCVRS